MLKLVHYKTHRRLGAQVIQQGKDGANDCANALFMANA